MTVKGGTENAQKRENWSEEGEKMLEGNLLGEFLLFQKHDGEQPIGTYTDQAEKTQKQLFHPSKRPPPALTVASLLEGDTDGCAETLRDPDGEVDGPVDG